MPPRRSETSSAVSSSGGYRYLSCVGLLGSRACTCTLHDTRVYALGVLPRDWPFPTTTFTTKAPLVRRWDDLGCSLPCVKECAEASSWCALGCYSCETYGILAAQQDQPEGLLEQMWVSAKESGQELLPLHEALGLGLGFGLGMAGE